MCARSAPARLELGHDLGEPVRIQAGAADQRPVDVGQGGQGRHVVRLDAAAVEDVALLGRLAPEPLLQPLADVGVRLTGLLRPSARLRPMLPLRRHPQ